MRLLLGVLIVQLVLLSAWQRPSRPVYHAITAMRTSANPRRNTLIALPATVSSSLPSNNIASKGMQSLTSDQGVQKLMLKAGNSKKLESGDILAVKYSLRLKDSSKVIAKGDEARFTFQDGTMIKGWDIALDSMKVGEQASFVIGSSYAYGEKGLGNGDIVPTNANLQLDIEVLAWLGNILQPETLFQKDLDIDPFVASTPETIQKEFEERQVSPSIYFPLFNSSSHAKMSLLSSTRQRK